MIKSNKFAMLATLAILASAAQADALQTTKDFLTQDIGVSAKVGSIGAGVDITKAVSNTVKIRAGFSGYSIDRTYSQDSVDYSGTLKLAGWNLLADYHPWEGGFRVSAGVYGPQHSLNANASTSASGFYEFNGHTYSTADVKGVNLQTKWNGVKPYLGMGYDGFTKTKSGLFFTSDFGVIFTGAPKTSLTATCTNAAVCAQLNADLAAERSKIVADVDKLKYLPVIQLGVGYKF